MTKRCDVAILGGGIAGAFLARHLKRARPELDVVLLEAAHKIDNYKVGESTVEVAASYMIRRLGLSTYLYQHQLPKNGLRFFFDSPDKDLPLVEMSEIGSDHMPFHPSFQLERAALERDVLAMNAADGVDVKLGAKVIDMSVARRDEGDHAVVYEQSGERHELKARWICDASGRRHLVQRKLGNKVTKESRLETGAAWGRYRNVRGLDAVEDPAFRARARWTSRHLSTNHFMYDGYWIWFIPLAGDLMSVGAVFDKRVVEGPRNRAELEAFLRSHRAPRDLMEGAVFEDFQSYTHLPYFSDRYFSVDRWGLTGEAGAFTDPFYSPGSDFIATANELLAALIFADLDGAPDLADRVEAYDAYYKLKYEATIRLYIDQYPIFGSFEAFRLKYLLDFNNYYNLVVWPFMADRLRDLAWVREELKFADLQVRAIGAMGKHFAELGKALKSRGEYFAKNSGQWANGLNGVAQFETKLGPELDEQFRRRELDRAYGSVFLAVLEKTLGLRDLHDRARLLSEMSLPVVLALKEANEDGLARLLARAGGKITKELQRERADAPNVVLRREGDLVSPTLEGAAASDEQRTFLARAREMWDTRSENLVSVRV